jgi:hypothetical protein
MDPKVLQKLDGRLTTTEIVSLLSPEDRLAFVKGRTQELYYTRIASVATLLCKADAVARDALRVALTQRVGYLIKTHTIPSYAYTSEMQAVVVTVTDELATSRLQQLRTANWACVDLTAKALHDAGLTDRADLVSRLYNAGVNGNVLS